MKYGTRATLWQHIFSTLSCGENNIFRCCRNNVFCFGKSKTLCFCWLLDFTFIPPYRLQHHCTQELVGFRALGEDIRRGNKRQIHMVSKVGQCTLMSGWCHWGQCAENTLEQGHRPLPLQQKLPEELETWTHLEPTACHQLLPVRIVLYACLRGWMARYIWGFRHACSRDLGTCWIEADLGHGTNLTMWSSSWSSPVCVFLWKRTNNLHFSGNTTFVSGIKASHTLLIIGWKHYCMFVCPSW